MLLAFSGGVQGLSALQLQSQFALILFSYLPERNYLRVDKENNHLPLITGRA